MNRQPRVSICLPNLNTRPFLEERMATILAQSFSDWELIISDNFSDDGSWEYLQQFKDDPRISLFQAPRRGMYANWNECLRRATGEYCYIATSDDTMTPDCLAKLVAPLDRFPQIHLAVCDFQEINEKSQAVDSIPRASRAFLGEWMNVSSIRCGKTEFLLHAGFGSTIWVTMTAVLFRRSLLDRIGTFRTDFGSKADEAWTLRASLASDIAYVPEKLATWRHHSRQATKLWDAREGELIMCRCLESVIRDPESGIPPAWKQIEGWDRAISAYHRYRYSRTFRLYRWAARQHPMTFLKDVWQSLRHAPGWLWHQVVNGFKAVENEEFDATGHTQRLLRLFNADWPPRRL